MTTIFLRFADRAEALSQLGSLLGFDTEQDQSGKQLYSSGLYEGARYHLSFLSDMGVASLASGDLVNLLWPDGITSPDFGAYAIDPTTPSCVFQAE